MTAMPIAHRILSGEATSGGPGNLGFNAKVLEGVTFFDVQEAADIYWSGRKDIYNKSNDIGVLSLPFDSVWLEWEIPNDAIIDGNPAHDLSGLRFAAFLSRWKYARTHSESPMVPGMGWDCVLLAEGRDGSIFVPPIVQRVNVNDDGRYVDDNYVYGPDINTAVAHKHSKLMGMCVLPAWLALGLINCRNVTTSESGQIGIKRSGREKRHKMPARTIRYQTIVLPGGGSVPDGTSGARRSRASALHRVRGHFKTYTKEKPLMGRHVGTYWWGWQVRGSSESGVVVSDYRLKGDAA
ncbi:hypothetical protein PBI_OMNICRON_54 [Mycobacterium phage Omnicron]|uniref:Uncharacterized protein n=1 Tax=Mycobacterium phage Omnicron TaxID=1541819 RepID=A0A088FRH5_9CAUD|nr:hypothetical protein PBI_OMNICRON_54 [Mycobacterium phage Omnicron]AIM50387.1 hypothetical protein PBI_OMNICRON_54 [Mycobacterium phage Omnicron]